MLALFVLQQPRIEALLFAGWALWTLGVVFAVVPIVALRTRGKVPEGKSYMKTTALVDTGLYAIVRHPQGGTAGILFHLALPLIGQHWLLTVLSVVGIALIYADTFKADMACIEKFGEEYARYMERVPRVNFVAGLLRLVARPKDGRRRRMIQSLADFCPEGAEAGVGLALKYDQERYLFILAGPRHNCPPGELFYAGIGGHLEPGETWLECAHREALEEVGTDVEILPALETWYIPQEGPARRVELCDRPRPLALYEMIHPPGTPRAGELYRLVVYQARLVGPPEKLMEDEVLAVIALTRQQVVRGLVRKPALSELLDEGARILTTTGPLDEQIRLYPLGTGRALAHVWRHLRGLAQNGGTPGGSSG